MSDSQTDIWNAHLALQAFWDNRFQRNQRLEQALISESRKRIAASRELLVRTPARLPLVGTTLWLTPVLP